jgi:hypothetical protein
MSGREACLATAKAHRMKKKKGKIGSSFDDFLKQDGICE